MHPRKLLLGAAALTLGASVWLWLSAPSEAAPAGQQAAKVVQASGQVIVGLKASPARTGEHAEAIAKQLGGRLVRMLPDLSAALIEAPGSGAELARSLRGDPQVAWAEDNRTAEPAGGPGRCTCQGEPKTTPAPLDIHGLGDRLPGLAQAWEEAPDKGANVIVAVVDTGVDQGTEALMGACETPIDLVVEGGPASDGHGHGTSMAGLIAGRGDGVRGFLGVAPRARILPVRVAGDRGDAPLDVVARGIVAAAERGAKVIYVGMGVRGRSPTLAAAVEKARAAGSLVICPAGNDGLDVLVSPAAESAALAVSGLAPAKGDADWTLAAATNISPAVRLGAPSEHIPAPVRGAIRWNDGTSVSAALTAGVAALCLSREPALDPLGLERALVSGGSEVFAQEGRLPIRALDPVGATSRAHVRHAELAVAEVRVTPDPPVVGQPAEVRFLLENRGQVPLASAELVATIASTQLTAKAEKLTPGEQRWVAVAWTPDQGGEWLGMDVKARGLPAGEDQLPVIARTWFDVAPLAEAIPSCGVAGIELVEWPTLDKPRATWEVKLENKGAAPGQVKLEAAVDGVALPAQTLQLGPGETAARRFEWAAADGQPPAAPVAFEACLTVEGGNDARSEDDWDTFVSALQDPSLPLSPNYRQAGDVDFGLDAPWRLAKDRGYLPLLVFVPSIGRPSRYATFHETLAMRRGVVARLGTNSSTGRLRSAANVAGRTVGNLATYTTATFLKELADAAKDGDPDAVRRFFDKVVTTDFAIDYAAYAAGSMAGAKGFELVASRAKEIRGLRWTGTSLGSTIARAQASVALGYLLPNLLRGRFDRRVAIDLAALGMTTAGVEALAAGLRAAAAKTTIGGRTAAWLANHGKIARAGGWTVEVAKLVLVLYASEWISDAIDRPIMKMQARRRLASSFEAAKAKAKGPEAEFQEALLDLEDAFDAYRNIISQDIEVELRSLNKTLAGVSRTLHQIDTMRSVVVPAELRESQENAVKAREEQATGVVAQVLKSFEDRFSATMRTLYDVKATSTLAAPGHSKPATYDLEVELLEELARLVPAERKTFLGQKVETLNRLRDLDIEITRGLLENAATEVVDPAQLAGTDGLLLKKARIVVRDSWQFEDEDVGELERVGPGRLLPRGSVKEILLYHHDVAQNRYVAAPGVVRTDENMAAQASPALLDMPRPLTVKGRYNILRIPRGLLEQVAVGKTVWIHLMLDWELTKVVRGQVVRPAAEKFAQMLQVQLGEPGLPLLPGLQGQYLDAHYHTIAEWYNPEPGFVADLELDAPRQKYGGPIPMLVESAWAVGAIDAPTFDAARDRLVTTDHNSFYVAGDTLSHRPPFGPTSVRQSEGRSEQQQMRNLLGQSAGEELCYEKDGLKSVGVHMLDYRAKHYDGTWNAKPPLGKYIASWLKGMQQPTMEKILGEFAQGGKGNENAFCYASHPVSSIPWEDEKLHAALGNYERQADKSFPFKGMQVWNTRSARQHSAHKLAKYLDNLNPFVNGSWQGGAPFDEDVHKAMVKYRHLLNRYALFRLPSNPDLRLVRKHYMIAGSDSHGDFNYTVGGLATVITAILGTNDWTDDTIEIHDSAFMKVRNFVGTQGHGEPSAMEALAHGSVVVTDGPLVWFDLDGDGRFDAEKLTYDATGQPRFKNAEGRIGGSGAYDGERTVLVANEARPVFRYSYTNNDEFGRPTHWDDRGRPTAKDGRIASISIYKTDLGNDGFLASSGSRMAGNGALEAHGGREFGKVFFEPMNPAEEGLPASVSAVQVGVSTGGVNDTSPADMYRAVTNPVWIVKLEIEATVDASKFDAATGTIAPGGLEVVMRSPISLAGKPVTLVLKALDAQGKSGEPLLELDPRGWTNGVEVAKPGQTARPYTNGVFKATNKQPLAIKALPRFGPEGKLTVVVMTKDALEDALGNKLNRVAGTVVIDPNTGKVSTNEGRGIIDPLERR